MSVIQPTCEDSCSVKGQIVAPELWNPTLGRMQICMITHLCTDRSRDCVPNRLKANWSQNKMHTFAKRINTRWKNSKHSGWKRLLDVFNLLSVDLCVNMSTCTCLSFRNNIRVYSCPVRCLERDTFESVFHSDSGKTAFWCDIKHPQNMGEQQLVVCSQPSPFFQSPGDALLSRKGLHSLLAKM